MDFIKMLGAVFFGILLSTFVIEGWMNHQANKALAEVTSAMKTAAEQANAKAKRMQSEASIRQLEAQTKLREAEERRMTAVRAAEDSAMRARALDQARDAAWRRFYQTPNSCTSPVNFEMAKNCVNMEIRKQREFNELWQSGKLRPVGM